MLLQPNRPPGLQAARGCRRHAVAGGRGCVTGLQARLSACGTGLQPVLRRVAARATLSNRVTVALLSDTLRRARAALFVYLLRPRLGLGLHQPLLSPPQG